MSLDSFAQHMWYGQRHPVVERLLLPLSWVFALIVRARRMAYRRGWLASVRVGRPVVVIGNLTVGGTGKTPLVAWLANECTRRGVRAAIVCRGYGGRATGTPVLVTAAADVTAVGDEAVLLAQSFDGLVIACADRVAGAAEAVSRGVQLVLCDDGLQHYRLHRDVEIIVVDAGRGFGNGRVLPSGPLREPQSRARTAQLLVRTLRGAARASVAVPGVPAIDVPAEIDIAVALRSGVTSPLAAFAAARVHAVAGIGNPDAFFEMLRAQGFEVDARPLPDHALLTRRDLEFGDSAPVFMTEKDAVKCRDFADGRTWYVPLRLVIRSEAQAVLWSVLQRALEAYPAPQAPPPLPSGH